jgi:hypothetical protein
MLPCGTSLVPSEAPDAANSLLGSIDVLRVFGLIYFFVFIIISLFMFRLTNDERDFVRLRSQIVTINNGRGQHSKYLPYAFTELGVAMLSSVLKSETAISVNREIMRAFVAFRHLATLPLPDSNAELRKEIQTVRDEMNEILSDQNDINESMRAQLDAISEALAELQSQGKRVRRIPEIGFVAIQKRMEDEEE